MTVTLKRRVLSCIHGGAACRQRKNKHHQQDVSCAFFGQVAQSQMGCAEGHDGYQRGRGVRQTPQIDIEGFSDASRSSPADVDQIASKDDHLGVVLRAIPARRKSGGVGIAAYILCADFFQTIIGGRSHHGFVGDDAGGIR